MNEENTSELKEMSTDMLPENTQADIVESKTTENDSQVEMESFSNEPTEKKFCAKCGVELQEDQEFCPKCGHKVGNKVSDTGKRDIKLDLANKKWVMPVCTVAVIIIAIVAFVALKGPAVENIILSQSSVEMKVDDTTNISYTISPSKASDVKVSWSSSNEEVATVNDSGSIKAVGEGTSIITVSAGKKSDSLFIIVKTGPDFQALYNDNCESTWASVGSDGSYLKIDTNPYDKDDSGVAYAEAYYAIIAINEELGLPDSLIEDMGSTTSVMGKQSETYSAIGLTVSWSYHPDKGLEVTYKFAN